MTEETIPLIDSKKYHKEEIVGFKICFRAFTKDPTMRDAEFDVGISNENKEGLMALVKAAESFRDKL